MGYIPDEAKENDYIMYNGWQVYQVQNGSAVSTSVDVKVSLIVVKENTQDTYILTITDSEGSYDTPNLRGTGSITSEVDPYNYAVSIGYTGTQEQFNENYLNSVNGVIDGGIV